jgi:hypothetical protein
MTEFPFIYICSHAGKIGNFRWVNSDTRFPDADNRWKDPMARRGYWGGCGLEQPHNEEIENRPLP